MAAFRILYKSHGNSPRDIDSAEVLLQKFVVGYKKIYYNNDPERLKGCTLQIHSLLHLPKNVRLFGPVSGFWQFPLERYVGTLERLATLKSHINKSLSNSLMYQEQFNYLFLIFNIPPPKWEDIIAEDDEDAYDDTPEEVKKILKIEGNSALLGPRSHKPPTPKIIEMFLTYLRFRGVQIESLIEWDPLTCSIWPRLRLQSGRIVGSKLSLKEGDFYRRNNICKIQNSNPRTGQNVFRHCIVDRFMVYDDHNAGNGQLCCALVRHFEERYDTLVGMSYVVRAAHYLVINVKTITRLVGVVSQSPMDGKWLCQSHTDSSNARWFVALTRDHKW